MTSKEKSEYHEQNRIILSNKKAYSQNEDTSTNSITTQIDAFTKSDLSSLNNNPIFNDLNFSNGMSNYFQKACVINELLQQTREEIRKDMDSGKSIKEQLKESSRLSAGILFKARSSRLGKTVFDVHKENQQEKLRMVIRN